MPRHTQSRSPRASQRGVVLVVVLVMLVVLGLAAAATMRGAASSEQLAQGARSQSSASQYAMAALMFCERAARNTPTTSIQVPPATTVKVNGVDVATLWERPSTWFVAGGGTQPNLVPSTAIQPTDTSLTSGIAVPPAPQCIAECVQLPTPTAGYASSAKCNGANEAVYVTARGFSGDFLADGTDGHTERGSAVWVQSILRLN